MAETRTIRTVLELNAQRFNAGAASAAASAKQLSSELASITDASGTSQQAYDRVANSLLGIGAAAATGLGLAAKAAMDWESAWAGVTKTVDGTPQEMAALEDGLRGLAKELPATHQEIAAVAEAAGQLGVESSNVVEFTRTMINLGETTNLSAEEAATGLARFANIMGTSQDDVDRLGAAIVGLGNNYATTESEILDMSMRLAGVGSQLELTEGDVLGLATAMSSVGIEAEAGGTAMSMGMKKIDAAVREGGASLEGFAEVAGMSGEQFAQLWGEDAAAGVDAFVQGLARIQAEGGDVTGTLTELGITGIREADTFLRLAGSADMLSSALETGNSEYEKNLALTTEAAKRYETTESQIQLARNAIVDAGIDIGGSLLPILADTAEGIAGLADAFSQLPGPLQDAVAQFGALIAVSGLVGGGILKIVPAVTDTVAAFQRMKEIAPQTASALGKLGRAAGVAIAGFAGFSMLSSYGDSLTDFSIGAEEAAAAAMKLADGADPLGTVFAGMGEDAYLANASTEEMAKNLEVLANPGLYSHITDFAGGIANAFGANVSTMEDTRQRLEEIGQGLAGLAQTDLPAAQDAFNNLWDSFGGTDEAGLQLLETMPALRNELAGIANEAGLDATDQMTLLGLATGEIVPEMDGAAGAAGEFGDATGDATGEVEEQVSALEALQDALQETSNALLGMRGSARDFEAAIDEANASVEEHGRTLDITTEAGRANQEALDQIAESAHAYADAQIEAGASGQEIAETMRQGRESFIQAAEAMGMASDDAAALADQMGLIPETVDVAVQADTAEAAFEIADFVARSVADASGAEVEVPVGADTGPADEDVHIWGSQVGDVPVKTYVEADTYPAEEDLGRFYDAVNNSEGAQVTINGETMGAEAALDTLVEQINAGEGVVMMNGNPVPAEGALLYLTQEINSSEGVVTIDGNNVPAWAKTDQAKAHADGTTGTMDIDGNNNPAAAAINAAEAAANAAYGQMDIDGDNSGANSATNSAKQHADSTTGTIDVDANTGGAESSINTTARNRDSTIRADASTGAAESQLNNAARNRTSRITVTVGYKDHGIRFGLGRGRAEGGWLNSGLADGGWVPGAYPGPGVDNVIWPMLAPGAAGGKYLGQPLAGNEFVVNGEAAMQWGPALEAINGGMTTRDFEAVFTAQPMVDPAAIAAAVAAGARRGIEAANITALVSDRVSAGLYQRGKSASRVYGGVR